MRALSILFFLLGAVLLLGGLSYLTKPAFNPLAAIVGALALPALCFWWGWIFHGRAQARLAAAAKGDA
jgi:hypothetical protein